MEDPPHQTLNVIAGHDVALLCDVVSAKPPPEIVWYTNDGQIIPAPTPNTDVNDNKMHYRDGGRYLVILELEMMNVMNVGYRCGVTNARIHETVKSNKVYELKFVSELPQSVVFYKKLENRTGLVGEDIEFTAVAASATGDLAYSFKAPGLSLHKGVNDRGFLTIQNVPIGSETYEVTAFINVLATNNIENTTAILTVQGRNTVLTSLSSHCHVSTCPSRFPLYREGQHHLISRRCYRHIYNRCPGVCL